MADKDILDGLEDEAGIGARDAADEAAAGGSDTDGAIIEAEVITGVLKYGGNGGHKPSRIAKTQAQIAAESKLASNPEMQGLVDKVLEDEEKVGLSLTVARKRNKREQAFSEVLATAERYTPDYKEGLTHEQVASRREKGLVNFATKSNAKTYRSIFFQNLFTFFNLLCVIVAIALIFVQSYSDLFFMVIMLCNVVISIFQEIRAKLTIERLSLISAPIAIVVRNGERIGIPITEVVLDDILFLENGKQICSDCVIVRGEVEVNESMLTGESAAVHKRLDSHMFAGTFISSGSCYARVEKIGSANYIENLTAFAKRYRKPRSELLSTLKMLITIIAAILVPLSIVLFFTNYNLFKDLQATISYTAGGIIGMIPAGMFLLTSTALYMSVYRLGKKHVQVQDLYCIEMLARVNTLCLDKTGTITDGTMQVNEIIEFANNNDSGYSLSNIVGSLLSATHDNNQTAVALINKFGYSRALKPLSVLPFSSQRKFSAVTFDGLGTIMLGAPEFVMNDMGIKMETLINDKAKDGMRVLMLAFAPSEIKDDRVAGTRKPLALIVIEDHIREDAPETLRWFRENDVAIKVISGDNPVTVSEVAKRVGIVNADRYVSLEGMTDPEVVELANQYTVFGRVTPEQKRLLIKSMKAKGNTVAMTGDGVNDILALKEADCSVAIASGSEAARNVSHMVLMDSNFGNMPAVVHEGRRVVNNIQKSSSLFLMKTTFTILMTILVIIIGRIAYPFRPIHLMLLEIFIIGVPSFCLAFQSNKNRIQGRFLTNILKNALPSGLTLILSYLTLYVLNVTRPGFFTSDELTSAAVIVMTFAGSVQLFKLSLPYDTYRLTVWGLSALTCMLFMVFLGPSFGVIPLSSLEQYLVVLITIYNSFVIVTLLSALVRTIKIS